MLTLLKRLASAVATPASGKITLFADSTSGEPYYKDDTGTTHPLVAAGAVTSVNGSTGAVTLGGESIAEPVNALTNSAGTVAINCALGDYFTLSLSANVTSITFSNLPASGKAQTIMIRIVQDATGSRTATWPSSFKWAGGSAGALSTAANSVDVLALTTFNQGTTWDATLAKAFA